MKLSFMLQKNCILMNMRGGNRSKEDILREMVDSLYENTEIREEKIGKGDIIISLLEREKQQTTSLGEGFAFPHGRFPEIKSFYLMLGICQEGVEFNSLDDKTTNFFILTLVPNTNPEILLKVRAATMRFLMPVTVRKEVLAADTSDDVWNMIDRSSIEVDYEIRASEIMRPQIGHLSEDMTLKEAARSLHRFHADALPVIDAKGNFVKVISCNDIFSMGLPDLFSTLSKIPDATDTSSFEKFFKVNPKLKVKDLKVGKDSCVINADASLIEIIYEMAVKGQHLLYVLDEKKLIGAIDRCNIIDKIIMY